MLNDIQRIQVALERRNGEFVVRKKPINIHIPSSIIIIIVWLEREFLCQQEWHVSTIVNRVGIYSSHSRWTTNQINETDLHIILGRITNYIKRKASFFVYIIQGELFLLR